MSYMKDLLTNLCHLRMAPVSPDMDKFEEIVCKELPFEVHEYYSGTEFNGWVVPEKWHTKTALIKKDGKIIYDGMKHPLGVIGSSQSFKGTVDLEELKKHLFFKQTEPDVLVYHCDLYYKVGMKNWGFCMPLNEINKLTPGNYEVELETVHEKGKMKVFDFFIKGEIEDTIIFNAHNCHSGQANDDISGVVVGIEVMRKLLKTKNRYSYRLIVAPEHFGTVFYLKDLDEKTLKTFKYCYFLEMLGNKNRFALQETFTGESLLDKAAHHYLKNKFPDYFSDKFRKIVGNDETVWEAPGYEVPTVSLSRWPYREYHSSLDNETIISEEMLEEAAQTVMNINNIIETNYKIKRKFTGLIALSNPKYNLYIRTDDPSIAVKVDSEQKKWNYLMDCIPRYFDGKMTILEIALKHELDHKEVKEYLEKFEKLGLIEFIK